MAIHLAFGIEGHVLTLRELGDICNTPDRQILRRFVDEHSYLSCHMMDKGKYVLWYRVPTWMRDFFLDPTRCQYLYSTSLVIDQRQKAIKNLILVPNPGSNENKSLVYFFTPTPTSSSEILIDNIANATHLLESARNGSDRNELLFFPEYLSKIHWFDIYNRDRHQRYFTDGIVHWACTTLVGCFLPP